MVYALSRATRSLLLSAFRDPSLGQEKSASPAADVKRRGLQAEEDEVEAKKELPASDSTPDSASDSDDSSATSDAYGDDAADVEAAAMLKPHSNDKAGPGVSGKQGGASSSAFHANSKSSGSKVEAGGAGSSEKGQKVAKKSSKKQLGFPSPSEASQDSAKDAGREEAAEAAGEVR